jgi:hypothetical protein
MRIERNGFIEKKRKKIEKGRKGNRGDRCLPFLRAPTNAFPWALSCNIRLEGVVSSPLPHLKTLNKSFFLFYYPTLPLCATYNIPFFLCFSLYTLLQPSYISSNTQYWYFHHH